MSMEWSCADKGLQQTLIVKSVSCAPAWRFVNTTSKTPREVTLIVKSVSCAPAWRFINTTSKTPREVDGFKKLNLQTRDNYKDVKNSDHQRDTK